jgi:hypothetical protein
MKETAWTVNFSPRELVVYRDLHTRKNSGVPSLGVEVAVEEVGGADRETRDRLPQKNLLLYLRGASYIVGECESIANRPESRGACELRHRQTERGAHDEVNKRLRAAASRAEDKRIVNIIEISGRMGLYREPVWLLA